MTTRTKIPELLAGRDMTTKQIAAKCRVSERRARKVLAELEKVDAVERYAPPRERKFAAGNAGHVWTSTF